MWQAFQCFSVKRVHWRYTRALFYFFCQLACLIGVIVSLLLGKTFLLIETPIGIISSYGFAGPEYSTIQSLTYAGNLTAPCGSLSSYTFQYDSTFLYEKPVCSFLSADELIRKSASGSLFITTHIDHKRTYRTSAVGPPLPPPLLGSKPLGLKAPQL